ncbi:Aldo/keto reductase [Penicillium verhagenii]|uniref:Aldo/keto reductase n=1 Tax=Penicillium verhagenii TaxID=1562060 RepID=UPI0025452C15|nr:Aldo/keto reductase [Penicillium verhagenii]KAJ5928465.1 Aldo/keto reductase [Penicillium verhagenii]
MTAPNELPLRQLGRNGPFVPRLGLGLMSLSGVYNEPLSEPDHFAFLDEAYKQGETFWDTGRPNPSREQSKCNTYTCTNGISAADKYGTSEEVLGRWFAVNPDKREHVFLSTKFGIRAVAPGKDAPVLTVDSTPEYCREAIESSLRRLNLPYVDIYYIHRLDQVTPIEKTIEAMVELKNAGKIKHLGLSECSAESLRRAHAVHPITAVQVEYSLFCRDIESPEIRLLETARELGVTIVCYSPLGNGLLTNTIHAKVGEKPEGSRGYLPWLKEENLEQNAAVIKKIHTIAASKNVSSAQLALAWLLAQGDDIFPIPGTIKAHRVAENLESVHVSISADEEKALREIAGGIVGGRFQAMTGYVFADTPEL